MRNDQAMTPSRFRELTDSFGGDIERWPVGEQQQARTLAARDPALAAMLGSEAVFDRLLGLAPAAAPASEALVDRIVAAARQEAAAGPRSAKVITLPRQRRTDVAGSGGMARGEAASSRSRPDGSWWISAPRAAGAGGMLAASLLVGIMLGAAGAGAPSLGTAFASRPVAAADLDAMSEIVQTALPFDLLEGSDEEAL